MYLGNKNFLSAKKNEINLKRLQFGANVKNYGYNCKCFIKQLS